MWSHAQSQQLRTDPPLRPRMLLYNSLYNDNKAALPYLYDWIGCEQTHKHLKEKMNAQMQYNLINSGMT